MNTTTPLEGATTVAAPSASSAVSPTPGGTTTVGGAPAPSSGFLTWLEGSLNPFTGTSFLPNAALVLVGIVLAMGALLIAQKGTVVEIARGAA